jgi:hypothetical protein
MAKAERGSDKYTVRIPDDLRDTMLKHCKIDNVTPSELIRKALGMYLLGRDCNEQKIKSSLK